MHEVNPKPPKRPADWELAIFTCDFCGGMWRFDTAEEAEAALEMWGMGVFAYFKDCPRCKKKLAVEVPLLAQYETLFRYVYELEQKVVADERQ